MNDLYSRGHWTVTRSRHALRDRWISVRADDCVTSSGISLSPYYVLEFPDFVHTLAIDEQDRVILVRQYRHGYGGHSLELPGGVMEPCESIVLAVQRELEEETGYSGGNATHVVTLSVDPARYANRLHLVVVRDVRLGTPKPDVAEDIEVVTVSRLDAIRLATVGEIVNAQHVGLLLLGLASVGTRA